MHVATYAALMDEIRMIKTAAFIGPGADLAGLGMLAVPGVKTLRDPNASAKEKNHAKWETAGLGTLAAGVAVNDHHELAEGARNFAKSKGFGGKMRSAWNLAKGGVGQVAKHASVTEGALSLFKRE